MLDQEVRQREGIPGARGILCGHLGEDGVGYKSVPARETLFDGPSSLYQFQYHILSSLSVLLGPRSSLGTWWSFAVRTREHLPPSYTGFVMKMSPWGAPRRLSEEGHPSTSL